MNQETKLPTQLLMRPLKEHLELSMKNKDKDFSLKELKKMSIKPTKKLMVDPNLITKGGGAGLINQVNQG